MSHVTQNRTPKLLRVIFVALCLFHLPSAFAENWNYLYNIDKSFYTEVNTNQSQALINANLPVQDVIFAGQSLKISIRIPAGVALLSVSGQGVFDGPVNGRPVTASFNYDPVTICLSNPDSCPSNGAPLKFPPFHANNSSFTETAYQDTALTVEEANANGGTFSAVALYHGAAAPEPFGFFGPLAISIGISDVAAYNAWVRGTAVDPTYALNIATEGNGTVSSSPSGINCGNGFNSCSTSFNENAVVTLTATAGANTAFQGWGGDCQGNLLSTNIAMTKAKSCTAIFANTEIVTLRVGVNGEGNVTSNPSGLNCKVGGEGTCDKTSVVGDTIVLTAVDSDNAAFTNWSGDCSGTDKNIAVVMTSNKQCTANFQGSGNITGIDIPVFSILHPNHPNGFAGTAGMQVFARLDEFGDEPHFFSASDFLGVNFPLEDSLLTLNVNIKPDASLGADSLDVFLLALWEDQQGNQLWLEKYAPQGSFDFNDSDVWKTVDITAALTNGFTTYRSGLSSSAGFSTSFGSGRVVPPTGLNNEGRRLTLLPAYQSSTTTNGQASQFFVAGLLSLGLPDALLKSEYTVTVGNSISITSNRTSGSEYILEQNGCSIANGGASIASVQFNKSIEGADVIHSCTVTGLSLGTTRLNVTTNTGKMLSTLIRVDAATTP